MLSVEAACERLLCDLEPLPAESVPLGAAVDRFLAVDVVSPLDLPPFDNSAMDGYALRAAEAGAASATAPVRLRVLGTAPAGVVFPGTVEAGTCVRVFTGSALPAGADAVVMQEDTRPDPARPGEIDVLDRVTPWENVRFRGEDVRHGSVVLGAGERLGALRLGLLGALGVASVEVRRRPVVALLATGSELIEPGQPWSAGRIYESNRLTLAPLLARAGAAPRLQPLVPDSLEATRAALEQAFADADAVVTTGGVSVGELDFVKAAFEALGGTLDFWKVSMRPGKPFVHGQLGTKRLFGLPGNPVSAVVTYLLLVRPALLRWQGALDIMLPRQPGVLAEPVANPGDRRHFIRVTVDDTGTVRSSGRQASHRLASLALANGLVDVPPGTTWPAGQTVQVLRIDA